MSKSSGSTKRASSASKAENIEKGINVVKHIKFPKKGDSVSYDLGKGENLTINHVAPGYGSGGIIISRINGEERSRRRYGSSGYATAGTKSEAIRDIKDDLMYYVKNRE